VVEEKRAILGRGSSYGGLLSEGKYLGWDKRRGWKPPQEWYPRKRKGQTQGHDGAYLSLGRQGPESEEERQTRPTVTSDAKWHYELCCKHHLCGLYKMEVRTTGKALPIGLSSPCMGPPDKH
jgi:hypothetical protein